MTVVHFIVLTFEIDLAKVFAFWSNLIQIMCKQHMSATDHGCMHAIVCIRCLCEIRTIITIRFVIIINF